MAVQPHSRTTLGDAAHAASHNAVDIASAARSASTPPFFKNADAVAALRYSPPACALDSRFISVAVAAAACNVLCRVPLSPSSCKHRQCGHCNLASQHSRPNAKNADTCVIACNGVHEYTSCMPCISQHTTIIPSALSVKELPTVVHYTPHRYFVAPFALRTRTA